MGFSWFSALACIQRGCNAPFDFKFKIVLHGKQVSLSNSEIEKVTKLYPLYSSLVWISIVLFTLLVSCKKDTAEPIARFDINSHVAYAGRIVTFDATHSSDPDGEALSLQVRWDFEDDGIWDTGYSFEKRLNWSFQGSGNHRIRLEVKNQDNLTSQVVDSVKIFGPFPDSVMIDPRDNQQYSIVQINGIWIMAENLRYGTRIPSSIPQTDNNMVEYYVYDDDTANFPVYGGLYSQEETLNYKMHTHNQGICPPGWRVPDREDWDLVDIKVAHYFLRDYYGPGGVSGFNMQFGGLFLYEPVRQPNFVPYFGGKQLFGGYWTTYYLKDDYDGMRYQGNVRIMNTIANWDRNLNGFLFLNYTDFSYGPTEPILIRDWFNSVRCVKKKL